MRLLRFHLNMLLVLSIVLSPTLAAAQKTDELSSNLRSTIERLNDPKLFATIIEDFEAIEQLPGLSAQEMEQFKVLRRSISTTIGQFSQENMPTDSDFILLVFQYDMFLKLSQKFLVSTEATLVLNENDRQNITRSNMILGSLNAMLTIGATVAAYQSFKALKVPVTTTQKFMRWARRIGAGVSGGIMSVATLAGALVTYGYFNSISSANKEIDEENKKLKEVQEYVYALNEVVKIEIENLRIIQEAIK